MEGDAQLDACTLALLVIVQQVDGVTSKQQRDIFAYVLRPVGLQWKAVVERADPVRIRTAVSSPPHFEIWRSPPGQAVR